MSVRRLLVWPVLLIALPATALAHGGGLDANGGHHDRKNGGYHYHRGGGGGSGGGATRPSTYRGAPRTDESRLPRSSASRTTARTEPRTLFRVPTISAEAKLLDRFKKVLDEALSAVRTVASGFRDTPAGQEAARFLNDVERRRPGSPIETAGLGDGTDIYRLTQARGRLDYAESLYDQLQRNYPRTPEAAEARQLGAAVFAVMAGAPAPVRRAPEPNVPATPPKPVPFVWPEQSEGEEWAAAGGLKVAIMKADLGHMSDAIERARLISRDYPGTRTAREAERLAAEWEREAQADPSP